MRWLYNDMLWVYLEPYTFISEDSANYFLYNSKDKKSKSFPKSKFLDSVVKSLQDIDNLYSVKIRVEDLADESLYRFITDVQTLGFGDILDGNEEKPLLMPPLLNLQRSVERMKQHRIPIGENILSYLHEVAIYVNGTCPQSCLSCQDRFKQYHCCTKSAETLDPEVLEKFLFSISYTRAAVTLLGGNIFQYKGLDETLAILAGIEATHTLVVDWRNIPEDLNLLDKKGKGDFRLKILINDLDETLTATTLAQRIREFQIKQCWEICITSFIEYEQAEIISERLSGFVDDVTIRPFYNGQNKAFFAECIYIDQEELDSIELDRQGVFALQALNTNNFGKITILADGKVYANVNEKPLGNIQNDLKEMLCEELEKGTSWRRTRYELEPCLRCRYKLICPSPSNYELVIRKNNLCHIKPM